MQLKFLHSHHGWEGIGFFNLNAIENFLKWIMTKIKLTELFEVDIINKKSKRFSIRLQSFSYENL